ncbi:SDR family NAD(P)-dependent oxidoreductase [Ilumatobacter sp.]|uniref:SDR family NAD(P)-dependent oxidoreductase n=1 Tax=Ilumatobacter sp. TaxID=1967498 RepID=UPI003C3986DE
MNDRQSAKDREYVIGRRFEQPGWSASTDARLRRAFPIMQFAGDALAWVVAIPVTTLLRYDLRPAPIDWRGVAIVVLAAIAAQGAIGYALGLYRRRYHYASLEEVRVLGFTMAAVAVVIFVVAHPNEGALVPRTVPALALLLALVLAAIVRFSARLVEERQRRPSEDLSEPIIVYGAGRSGSQMIKMLLASPDQPYLPVALLDDDPAKAGLRVNGLRVRGTGADAPKVARQYGASSVLIAVPSLSGTDLSALTEPLAEAGLTVLILPRLVDVSMSSEDFTTSTIRPLTIEDLLGRPTADVDVSAIAGYIAGRRVLVTGAGGSIGSELCRQLHAFGPAKLFMLDRDESGLHSTQLSIDGRPSLGSASLVLADIRDRARITTLFDEHRPDVVFHAAALKHQPLLENNPSEAWKTNVIGTHNVLEAAAKVGVERFVNISSDKAADPAGVLGYSKRICERLTSDAARCHARPYVSVRFGNVLGSRGSMLEVFNRQIADGEAVTVTHPEITRFFMTVEEAVALTIQAGAIGAGGEVLVLDMGTPVLIEDVARRLIQQSGTATPIVYTGLRDGEKLHEVLFGPDEIDHRPSHPLISHAPVPPLSFVDLNGSCPGHGRREISIEDMAAVTWYGDAPPS